MPDDKRLDGILFDMDGTLFATEEIWYQSEVKLMNSFGVEWNRADHAICVGGPISRVTQYMIEKIPTPISPKELFDLEMHYIEREFAESKITWQPGAEELVIDAKKQSVPIALVTASSQHLVNLVSAQMDLTIFDTIVCGDDVETPKPSPDAYVLALGNLDLRADRVVAIEDSYSGVRSALGANLHVLCPPSHVITIEHKRIKFVSSLDGISVKDLEFWNW